MTVLGLESATRVGTEGGVIRGLESYVEAGGFTDPTDLPNLVGWWDAADASTFTYSSGVVVSQWADKSGTGHHLVPRAAPSRTTTQTPNGTPTVHFNSTPLERNATIHTGAPTLTLFAVMRQESDPHDRTFSFGPGSGADYGQVGAVAINPEDGPPFGAFPSGYRNGTRIATNEALNYNTWFTMVYVWDSVGNRLYIDGALIDTETGSPGNWNILNFTIGGAMNGGDVGATMQLAECGIYSDAKSVDDITDLSNYLMNRWTPPAVVYSDDFNRADGALGASWATFDGNPLAIVSNKVVTSATGNRAATWETTLANDQWAEGDVVTTTPTENQCIAPSVRMQGTNSGLYYVWLNPTNGNVELWRRIGAGSYGQLGSGVSVGVTSAKLRIEAEGTTIRAYSDGVLRITQTDANMTNGKAGMWAYSTTTTPMPTLDNFRCGELPYTP